ARRRDRSAVRRVLRCRPRRPRPASARGHLAGPGARRPARTARAASDGPARAAVLRALQRLGVLQRADRRARGEGRARAVARQRRRLRRRPWRCDPPGAARLRRVRRRGGAAALRRCVDGRVPGRARGQGLRRRRPGSARRPRRALRSGGRPVSAPQDPYLTQPLQGVHAIEASAGTGKTYTLATLLARLVLERGMDVGQILAVTFTEAATQELRARVRKRLVLAADVAAGEATQASPEAALMQLLIDRQLAHGEESRAALRRRLRQAADDIDLAALFTIHGFCARVLRVHALESGQGFDPPELLPSDADLYAAIAADLWRAHAVDTDTADHLCALWPQGPAALAKDLAPLVRETVLLPEPPGALPDPAPMLQAAAQAFAEAARTHGDRFRDDLLRAAEGKVLHGGSYKAEWIEDLFAQLARWCERGGRGEQGA